MRRRAFFTVALVVISVLVGFAQVDKNSDLYIQFKMQDSIFFERGFNQCDMAYLENHISDDLRFYHDQSGIQDRNGFFENTKEYICSNSERKPIRKVDANSLEVFPLYDDGVLYGVIQHGVHHFYIREVGKVDLHTGTAKFTSVWTLDKADWKISTVLSYDHQNPISERSKQ